MLEDKVRFVGSSGISNGDSGAGLWNSSGALIGMNIMVKHNPLQVKQTSDNRQKQYTYAIGGACVFVPVGVILLFASVSFLNLFNVIILFEFRNTYLTNLQFHSKNDVISKKLTNDLIHVLYHN